MSKVCTAEQAVAGIRDGAVVGCVGVIGWMTPDLLLRTLGERFERTGGPMGCTFYFACGTGDAMGIKGMDHVAKVGLMKRIVAGSYINPVDPKTGKRPELMRLIRENAIEAYSWPIGASMHWLREVARRSPGYLTKIGLGCYIDPAQDGGKFTAKCTEELVKKVNFEGQEYLFYPTWKLDVAFLRATTADELGNLSFEHEPILTSNIALAMAVKACGGKVIAQVKRVVKRGDRLPHEVRIPGELVDCVVVDPEQMMVTETPFDERYLGTKRGSLKDFPRLELSPHKVTARLVAREVRKGELSVFGFGASSDAPLVMAEDGDLTDENLHEYSFTTEHGSFGGVVMSGWQFSANMNPVGIIDGVTQFDLINGGLCKLAALAFAQIDEKGRINVSKFAGANPGAGGFTDIAYNAKRLVFAGTITTGGTEMVFENGEIRVAKEGKVKKLVKEVGHITYDILEGVRNRGQEAVVATERAVFRMEKEGLALMEVAPGVDVRKDVLEQMEFRPARIAEPLGKMDGKLFR